MSVSRNGPAGGTDSGAGSRVYTVEWLPGSDLLLGRCFCGAQQEADDPVALWSWLLSHPGGHTAAVPARGGGPR
ncbi:MAG TPA: hypothetical protein VIS29_23635 [Streptomyces sp.]